MRKNAWVGATLALLAGCKADYQCGPYVYSEAENRCVCPPGSVETEDRRCILADGGVLYPPGWDGAVAEDPDAGVAASCPDGRPQRELFEDADGDGHGRIGSGAMGCEGTPGRVALGDDCDDTCRDCYPGAIEICDGRDNDCESGPDDTFGCVRGAATECETSCGSTGVVACGLDCAIPAGATCTPPEETCNGADDDCDGIADEGVLSFGEPVDWSGLAGDRLRLESREGGAIAVYISETGIAAREIDAAGALVGSPVELATVANVDFLDTDLRGDTLYVAYAVETTFPAHELYLLSADVTSLDVSAGPRRIASLPSSPGTLHVEHSFGTMVFYEPFTGVGIRMRAGTDIATSTFAERTVVGTYAGNFDVISPAVTTTRAYVVYAGRASEAEDFDLFVQAVTPNGTEGAPLPVTDDGFDDNYPVVADNGDRLGIAWYQRAEPTASLGIVRVASVSAVSGASTDEVTTVDAISIGPLSTLHITARQNGWIAMATDAISETSSRLTARAVAIDAASVGAPLVTERDGFLALPSNAARIGGSIWIPLASRSESPRLDGVPLGCR